MQFIATYVTQFCSGFFFSIKNRTKGTSPFPPNSLPSMGSHTWLVAIIVGAFVSLLWWYRWNQRKIPGPNGWPIIGSLPELLANWDRLHDFMVPQFSNAKTMYVQLPFFLTSVYTVDPACVEQLLKTRFENYPKGINNEVVYDLLGDGIFSTDGHKWKEQRRVASYEFSASALRDFSTNVFREHALKLVSILAQNARTAKSFDLQDLCMRMTLDTTCKVGFGVELGCLAPSLPDIPFARCFDDAGYFTYYRYADPLWKLKRLLSWGREQKLKKCLQVLDEFSYKVIKTRRNEIASLKPSGESKPMRSDLLSRFMDLSKRNDGQFTDKSLRDMILNFIIAGRDTTAITLSWFFYMMSRHPEVADKILQELSLVDQQCSNTEALSEEERLADFAEHLTYDTLGRLVYLHAAVTETLRLFPAVPLAAKMHHLYPELPDYCVYSHIIRACCRFIFFSTPRTVQSVSEKFSKQDSKQAAADDVLPDGSKVTKGSLLGYVPYSMGRMEFLWGEDALEFKPERWLKNGHFQPESPFKFTTFQAGPRVCLGKDSAYLQMKMTAALLLRFFRIHLVPGHVVQYRTTLVLSMLHGLQVTVLPRSAL